MSISLQTRTGASNSYKKGQHLPCEEIKPPFHQLMIMKTKAPPGRLYNIKGGADSQICKVRERERGLSFLISRTTNLEQLKDVGGGVVRSTSQPGDHLTCHDNCQCRCKKNAVANPSHANKQRWLQTTSQPLKHTAQIFAKDQKFDQKENWSN